MASDAGPEHGGGGLVAAGTAIGLTVAFGPAFIASFGLYVKPIASEFGWSRTDVTAIYSLVTIMGALGTPLLGFMLDRGGSRPVIVASSIALPAALMVVPVLPPSYAAFLAAGILLGLISIIASPTAYVSLLPQWFSSRLGMAVALAMFGSGLGQFVLTSLHGRLLEQLPWRTAWSVVAALVALVGILTAVTTARDRPGVLAARRAGRGDQLPGAPLTVALRSRLFWTASISFLLVQLVTSAMLTHLAPLLTDRGVEVGRAAGLIGTIGLFSLAGRALSGAVLDRYGVGPLGLAIFPLQGAGCLLIASGADGGLMVLAAGGIGLAYGVEADMLPWLLRREFGLRCFGRLYGMAFGAVQFGGVVGPLVMAVSFDRLGGYSAGLAVLSTVSAVATILITVVARMSTANAGRDRVPEGSHP